MEEREQFWENKLSGGPWLWPLKRQFLNLLIFYFFEDVILKVKEFHIRGL